MYSTTTKTAMRFNVLNFCKSRKRVMCTNCSISNKSANYELSIQTN